MVRLQTKGSAINGKLTGEGGKSNEISPEGREHKKGKKDVISSRKARKL